LGRGASARPGLFCFRRLHRQSTGALTSRAAFPLTAHRFRNRLTAAAPLRDDHECSYPRNRLVSDPDSRNLKTPRGWVQGYNAQAVVTDRQIVIAADISTEGLDTANVVPMVTTACEELQAAGVTEEPEVVLADAGYWKNDAIEALVAQGIQTLVAPHADRRKDPRPGRRGGLYDFMRRVLATDLGQQLYARRQTIVEPVFGQIKHNRGANRFARRGRSAVRSEWRLLTATHNLRG
jgi:hypothetical protein